MYIINFKNTLLLKIANHLTMKGCHKPSMCKKKKAISVKCNKAKHNKMKYAYNPVKNEQRTCISNSPKNIPMWPISI